MRYMEELEDMLCDELKEITTKGKVTAENLEMIDKLTHSIKSIETILAMSDYSYDYPRESSYGRRRDSMGRYSRDMGHESNTDMVAELHEMMEEAKTEKEREAIRHCISQMN